MGELRASWPRFRREGEAPRIELTDDDVAILRQVYRHRFVRADDLYRLFGERSADRLSRRLTLLFRNEFLDRPIAQVDRYRAGGSQSLVYGLGNAGARYFKETLGLSIGATDWRSRNRTYTRENLDHTLAVSRFLIDLELACRAQPDVSLITFEDILARAPEETRRSRYPMKWPVPVQWSSGRVEVNLMPDAIFGLRQERPSAKPLRSYTFLEIDRGTMTITPAERVRDSEAFLYRATVLRKFLTYAESWRQGMHKIHLGIPAARVLTLTTSAARAEAMREAAFELAVRPLRLPASLFLFGILDEREGLLAIHFLNASGAQCRLLLQDELP